MTKTRWHKPVNVALALVLVATLAPVILPLQPALASPDPGWYDVNWQYRRAITLSPATSMADYQVLVTLTTDIMGNPYAHVKSDGSDIRFTDSDGTTLLDYWIETWNNTGDSKIWVEVKTPGTSTIYMYYGNAAASSASDGDATFMFFDDFSGTTLDTTTKWIIDRGTPTVNNSLFLDNDELIYTKTWTGNITRVRFKTAWPDETGKGSEGNIGLIKITPETWKGCFFTTYWSGNWSTRSMIHGGSKDEHTEITKYAGMHTLEILKNGTEAKFYVDDSLKDTDTTYVPDMALPILLLKHGGNYIEIKWVFASKYASPEPSASVGSEEALWQDEWHDASGNEFKYRKPVTISNSGSSLSYYQVLVTSDTASLITAGKMQSDCDDIRFVYEDGTNYIEIPYWIESGCNTTSTKIWVKVPSIPTGDSTIYMYYGNAAVSSASDGDATFMFFDDFEPDSDKWIWTGDKKAFYYGGHAEYNYGTEHEGWVYSNVSGRHSWAKSWLTSDVIGSGNFEVALKIKANGQKGGYYTSYSHELIQINDSGDTTLDSNSYSDWTKKTYSLTGNNLKLKLYAYAENTLDYKETWAKIEIDDIRVRKYASPEPSASVGSEEDNTPKITIDEPTESSPVYKKGGEQFWVNFTYTELNPANYTVKIYNSSDVINSSSGDYPEGGGNKVLNVSFYLNSTAVDGFYNVSVEMYDNSSNWNITYQNYSVVKDEVPPTWQNLGSNTTTPLAGASVLLYAQGKDETALNYAVLSTNESGTWENITDGRYGSPMDMSDATDWTWSNFTWQNASVPAGTTVGWRIWYNDTAGNWNKTDIMCFTVQTGEHYISDCSVLNDAGAIYYLTADITDSAATTCMRITAENVTLDCQGHTIDGTDTGSTIGIYSNQFNTTVRNCVVTDWREGIVFEGSNNGIIENTTLDSNLYESISLFSSSGCTIANNTVSNSVYGIKLQKSSNNNRIINNNASNSDYGIYLDGASYNTIANNDASNSAHGIYLNGASYNTITNNTANSCNNRAISLDESNNNILANNTAKHSNFGIYISSSFNNTVKNSRIEYNSKYGIYMYSAVNPANHIYNNLFNNTNNFGFAGTVYANNWNTTKQAGTNIVGKPYIGGNYWGKPDGTGYSDTCWDTSGDYICEKPYTLDSDNVDYLPLTVHSYPGTPITNCKELQSINDNLSGDYYLANDIDCSEHKNFDPIGPSLEKPFTGTFDGRGYKITNLYINRPKTNYIGLFGIIASGAKIENVGVEKVSVIGKNYVGGLVGYVDEGATVNNCYCTGDIDGKSGIGGLAGHNKGLITNSYSSGSVSGSDDIIGGLVGCNEGGGTIDTSYSNSDVSGDGGVGGLVGVNGGNVSNCYSKGNVSGDENVGGLVGDNGGKEEEHGAIRKSYSTGSVSGDENVGGLVGVNGDGNVADSYYDINTSGCSDTGKGEPKTTAEMTHQATFVGWDFNSIWKIEEGKSYPCFMWQANPCPPVPDLPPIILFGAGLLVIVYAVARKRRCLW